MYIGKKKQVELILLLDFDKNARVALILIITTRIDKRSEFL